MRSGTGDKRHSTTESGRIIGRPNPKEHRRNGKTQKLKRKRSARKGHTKAAAREHAPPKPRPLTRAQQALVASRSSSSSS
jgi:hypothetical protein